VFWSDVQFFAISDPEIGNFRSTFALHFITKWERKTAPILPVKNPSM
jgi:hypothetical protein